MGMTMGYDAIEQNLCIIQRLNLFPIFAHTVNSQRNYQKL